MSTKRKKKPGKTINVRVGRKIKRHRPKKVGATTHRKKSKKRKGGFLGATGHGKIKEIAIMAVGVAAGAAFTHVILRPVEKRLSDKWPELGKFIAAGEVFLGGLIAIYGKHNFTKSVGVGVLSGGVHGLMKQANIYKEIPKLMGSEGYSEVRVPIHGNMDDVIAGLFADSRRNVRTQVVAGLNHTQVVAGELNKTFPVSGSDYDEVMDFNFVKS